MYVTTHQRVVRPHGVIWIVIGRCVAIVIVYFNRIPPFARRHLRLVQQPELQQVTSQGVLPFAVWWLLRTLTAQSYNNANTALAFTLVPRGGLRRQCTSQQPMRPSTARDFREYLREPAVYGLGARISDRATRQAVEEAQMKVPFFVSQRNVPSGRCLHRRLCSFGRLTPLLSVSNDNHGRTLCKMTIFRNRFHLCLMIPNSQV